MVTSHRTPFLRLVDVCIRRERWIILFLSLLALSSGAALMVRFWLSSTVLLPAEGGAYIEGSVGTLQPMNPWFTMQNDVNRDICSLVFSGLLRFDPSTKRIESDLADVTVSPDGTMYTATLKENVRWHDATVEKPHPVTADDVVFTFSTIQDKDFPGKILQQNFRGVKIERLDDRRVRFTLDRPYKYFLNNLTLGLLPKASFAGIPVRFLDRTTDFGFGPIGAGPYRYLSTVETDLSTEVTLVKFPRPISPRFMLDRIVFRIYSDYSALLSDVRTLDGIRSIAKTPDGAPIVPKDFIPYDYTLPQYVALFLNLQHSILQNKSLRLGLQLGIDKKSLVDSIGESVVVDTPLLEIDTSEWMYRYDPVAAKGALFESAWLTPEKFRLQRLLEERDANATGLIRAPKIVYLQTGAILTLTGSLSPKMKGKERLNGRAVVPSSGTGEWIVRLSLQHGSGGLLRGENMLKLTDERGRVLDTAYIRCIDSVEEYERALREQLLVDTFLAAKSSSTTALRAEDFAMENGYLRKRLPTDPPSIRVNQRGEPLHLALLTSPTPEKYRHVADFIVTSWRQLGVETEIVVPNTREEFEDRLLKRTYDVLLFGQSLLNNLDSYPYWHSSGIQKTEGGNAALRLDAYNLSQYASFEADTLLETIRTTPNERDRAAALERLRVLMKNDVPAIFLYSPTYTFAYRSSVQGIVLKNLSLHSDRFLTLSSWFVRQKRVFPDGVSWWSFLPWVFRSV